VLQHKQGEQRLAVVIRKFQGGAGITKEWNPAGFEVDVKTPISALIASAPPVLRRIVVVSCGDPTSKLAEAVDADGKTFMMRAVEAAFPREVESGLIKTALDTNWGQNPGSASALNVGWRAADDGDTDLVLSWNPDFILSGHTLACGLDHMKRHNLPLCGFYRKRWFERFQWNLFQNTATLYSMSLLREHGGFSRRCDGNDGETTLIGDTKVRIMGMDDWYFYFTVLKNTGKVLPWGMYGVLKASDWKVEFPGDDLKQREFDEKIARQLVVLRTWATEIFPDIPFGHLMDQIFEAMRQG